MSGDTVALIFGIDKHVMHVRHHFSVVKHSHKTNQTIAVPSAEHSGRPHQSLVQSFRIFSRNPTDRAKQSLRLLFGELLLFGIFDFHSFTEYYAEGFR